MAKPIEATPVLKGDDAFEFVSEMVNSTKASEEEKKSVEQGAAFLESMLTFVFYRPFHENNTSFAGLSVWLF